MKSKKIVKKNKDITNVFVVTAAILMIPLVAMQFTDEVKWSPLDFIVMGTLLIGTGLLMALASRKIKDLNHRVIVITALLITLILAWIELAVGIFGSPFAGS